MRRHALTHTTRSTITAPVIIPFGAELADMPDQAAQAENTATLTRIGAAVQAAEAQLTAASAQLRSLTAPFASRSLGTDESLRAVAAGDDGAAAAEAQGLSADAAAAAVALSELRRNIQWATGAYAELLDGRLLRPTEVATAHDALGELRLAALLADMHTRELAQLAAGIVDPSTLACLAIQRQPFPCSVKQNKPVGDATLLRVLTGARVNVTPVTQCKVVVVAPTSSKSKKQAVTVVNDEVGLDSNLVARFGALSFPTGSRLKSVQLKFAVQVSMMVDAEHATISALWWRREG